MRLAKNWRANNWADLLPGALGVSAPPVDLYAVARHRRVKRLGLRFMVPRAMLLPVGGGFEVYLRDTDRKDCDLSEAEPDDFLTPHQRFSLAHEIAHTFFYKLSEPVPAPDRTVSNTLELEATCDQVAGQILVPTALLKGKIEKQLGGRDKIDVPFVRSAASDFKTSIAVMIERLRFVESSNPFQRCILLAKRLKEDAEIVAIYFGVGMLPVLPRPQKYSRVTEWLADIPRRAIDRRENDHWTLTRSGRSVAFTKTELGTGSQFLLEARVIEDPQANGLEQGNATP